MLTHFLILHACIYSHAYPVLFSWYISSSSALAVSLFPTVCVTCRSTWSQPGISSIHSLCISIYTYIYMQLATARSIKNWQKSKTGSRSELHLGTSSMNPCVLLFTFTRNYHHHHYITSCAIYIYSAAWNGLLCISIYIERDVILLPL